MNTRKSFSKNSNDINDHVRSVQVVNNEFIQDYCGNVEPSRVKTNMVQYNQPHGKYGTTMKCM